MKEFQKKFLMGSLIIKDQWENEEQDGDAVQNIRDPRNTRIKEKSRRQRRTEATSEGGQDPEGAVAP